jgi:hypothetical protein
VDVGLMAQNGQPCSLKTKTNNSKNKTKKRVSCLTTKKEWAQIQQKKRRLMLII